jgi:hypothetical protein
MNAVMKAKGAGRGGEGHLVEELGHGLGRETPGDAAVGEGLKALQDARGETDGGGDDGVLGAGTGHGEPPGAIIT